MSTIFIGGSRRISRLAPDAKSRLANIMRQGHQVLVGDANGADKAVQHYFWEAEYEAVTVFCSGDVPRNNLGGWRVQAVDADKGKGFQFYAAKDRAMASTADFGFMIWDGRSPGTMLNVFRLLKEGKVSVLYDAPRGTTSNFRLMAEWTDFLSQCPASLRTSYEERLSPDERASCLTTFPLLDLAAEATA